MKVKAKETLIHDKDDLICLYLLKWFHLFLLRTYLLFFRLHFLVVWFYLILHLKLVFCTFIQ